MERKSVKRVARSETGTSLIELLMATAAGLVILAAAMQAISGFQSRFAGLQSALARQQDLRLGLELLAQELNLTMSEALWTVKGDEIEFGANVNGLSTTVVAPASAGQVTIAVEDGRAWPERKAILACWHERCEAMTLARDGQRATLTVTQPIAVAIPAGAFVSVRNRVRYYSRRDERGIPRFLRQVDGGASVLVGDIQEVRFSYWTGQGRPAVQPSQIRKIVVEMSLSGRSTRAVREISLRT